jgi:hypothetical protein
MNNNEFKETRTLGRFFGSRFYREQNFRVNQIETGENKKILMPGG